MTSSIQLESLRGGLSVIAYRRWNVRALEAPQESIKQERQGSETYIQFPKEIEKENGAWESLESIPDLEERDYKKVEIVRNFLTKECGGKCTSFGKSFFPGHVKISNTNMGPVLGEKIRHI